MKLTKHILASAVLLATSSFAIAAVDSTDITINVTKDAYVNLIGSLSTSQTLALTEAEVNGVSTVLGTLGTESNTTGGCDIEVTSTNTFKLQHNVENTLYLHGASEYNIDILGQNFDSTSGVFSSPTCTIADTTLVEFNAPAIPATSLPVQAGIYSDTINVTVTTQ